jgi:hypothetical protein
MCGPESRRWVCLRTPDPYAVRPATPGSFRMAAALRFAGFSGLRFGEGVMPSPSAPEPTDSALVPRCSGPFLRPHPNDLQSHEGLSSLPACRGKSS